MSNTNIIEQIKEVKELIKNKTFDASYEILEGFNRDIDLFDFNYGDFVGTISRGEDNKPVMSNLFDIYCGTRCYGTFELKEKLDCD